MTDEIVFGVSIAMVLIAFAIGMLSPGFRRDLLEYLTLNDLSGIQFFRRHLWFAAVFAVAASFSLAYLFLGT